MKEKYKDFISTFQEERDFFKCHEILEDIWIEETSCNTRKHVAINLLLISVGALHWKNKNFKGALKVLKNSLENYDDLKFEIEKIGVDSSKLKIIIEDSIGKISLEESYNEIYLPLIQ